MKITQRTQTEGMRQSILTDKHLRPISLLGPSAKLNDLIPRTIRNPVVPATKVEEEFT